MKHVMMSIRMLVFYVTAGLGVFDAVHSLPAAEQKQRVQEVSNAVQREVSADEFARIGFYSPDEFFAYLKKLAEENPEEPEPPAKPGVTKTKKKRGWTLKSETAQLTPEEAKQAEERALRAIAETLRKTKPDNSAHK